MGFTGSAYSCTRRLSLSHIIILNIFFSRFWPEVQADGSIGRRESARAHSPHEFDGSRPIYDGDTQTIGSNFFGARALHNVMSYYTYQYNIPICIITFPQGEVF